MVEVDPGVDYCILFGDIIHFFGWILVCTARSDQLCAFAGDGMELEGAVGVEEIAPVLPDKLALDAFWFSSCSVWAGRSARDCRSATEHC